MYLFRSRDFFDFFSFARLRDKIKLDNIRRKERIIRNLFELMTRRTMFCKIKETIVEKILSKIVKCNSKEIKTTY